MVIWLIGMSASGKSTLAKEIYSVFKAEHANTVLLDGDMVRAVAGNDLGHTVADRWDNAQRISRLCLELDKQGINVVCAVLSIFHESQRWNRENFSSYKEIFLDVSMEVLRKRDPRGLYARALNGEEKNVVGVDIEFPPPCAPDLVINNDRDRVDMAVMSRSALQDLGVDFGTGYRYSARNLLEHPEKYEYSEYQGVNFLVSYRQSRNDAMLTLRDTVQALEQAYAEDGVHHPWVDALGLGPGASFFFRRELPVPALASDPTDELTTRNFLCRSVDEALLGKGEVDFPQVLELLRRFEVSKKVHSTYALPNLRPAKGSNKDLANYGLLGVLLGILYHQPGPEQKLILMNALLKINDVLVSTIGRYRTPIDHYLALVSLRQEQEIYCQFQAAQAQ